MDNLPFGIQKLIAAYPSMNFSYQDNILSVNGEKIVYDDGKQKSFIEQLDNCDIEDMFAMKYDTSVTIPSYLSDAGRGRCETLFKAMYGHSASKVAKN